MLKEISRISLVLLLCIFSVNIVYAAISEEQANYLAEKWVPSGSKYLKTNSDEDAYEVKFIQESTGVFYEIEINKVTEQVQEVKTRIKEKHGSNLVKLQVEDIKDIVLSEFPDAKIQEVELDIEANYKIYEVKFSTTNVKGEMEINPETGVVLEREIRYFN